MTEEQIFKKRFPEYCVNEVCLSPYFDLFQLGFEECEKQNEELKEKLEVSEKLRDYWKGSAFDWRHKFFEKRSTKRLVKKSKQLAKAKEIIKSFSEFANNEVEYDPEHPQEHTDLWVKLCEQAEQFLKEVSE